MSMIGNLLKSGIDVLKDGSRVVILKGFGFRSQKLTVSGAIRGSGKVSFVELDHISTIIAATLAAPKKGQILVIADTSASGTAAHTVTLAAGTWDGTNDVATFNAPSECLVLFGISDTRFVVVENIGSVAFS
ncbi:MAG: hypothetical protein KAS32_29905 [Candidatus Peribacteraceae bacterium]|nr:hypothetical protein [Candidatus Peribacteraceae bacterium]